MATVKFPSEMPSASNIAGGDKLMISKQENGEAYQATFDQAKTYLNITGIELEPLEGGADSAEAVIIPNGPEGQERSREIASGRWFKFGSSGTPFQSDPLERQKTWWNGTTWSLVDMGSLPIQEGVDVINPSGDALPKEKAVAKYVDPLKAMINGGVVVFGETDLSSYTTNNSQEMLFLHRAFPIDIQGDVIESIAVFHRAGAFNIYIARPVPGQSQRFTLLGKTPKTAVVGTNTLTSDIDTLPGDLLAIGQVEGGALIKTKVGTNGLWLNTTTSNADVANGTEVLFSGSNRIMALNFKVSISGIQGEVLDVSVRVDNVEGQVNFAMKEPDLTIKKSVNRFDPSKIVDGKYVTNTGSVAPNVDFKSILINVEDVEDGEDITLNGFNTAGPGTPSYFASYSTDDPNLFGISTLIEGSEGTFSSNPVTFQKPAGAIGIAANILRTDQTEAVYANATINLGNVPIPYQEYSGDKITEYKGIEFAGANNEGGYQTNQNTRTTDSVSFLKVTADELESNVLIANIPEWDEVGTNTLLADQAYKLSDGGGNFFIKSKGGA